ncbi:hypothetical protein DPMN_032793 [Dreissena polymorpha]|uniref:Uncharacterized protein n=1 Tax=Dreissena polymorpha TaxID=45954 RepID=A0A9D4RIL1_DREPO|nr:hypothetical protein DPMN_032793 [Dreissena polymorpha]
MQLKWTKTLKNSTELMQNFQEINPSEKTLPRNLQKGGKKQNPLQPVCPLILVQFLEKVT